MAQDQDDKGSIWASRTSPDATAFRSMAPRRARAGTLPSRLPSRISTEGMRESSLHHGSLALISPDGNDIVYDSFPPSSRSAVGQQPGSSAPGSAAAAAAMPSINTPPVPTPGSAPGPSGGLASFGSERRKSPPLAPIPEPESARPLAALGRSGSPSTAVSPSPMPSLAPPATSGRARSGSLNSLAMRAQYPYNPFVTSIWGPGSHTPLQAASSSSSIPGASIPGASIPGASIPGSSIPGASIPVGSVPNTSSSPAAADLNDPMAIFSQDLNKSSNPLRIRSYTLDGAAAGPGGDWAAATPPQQPSLQFAQRARAQTLVPPTGSSNLSASLGGSGLTSQQIALNRFGKQHQLLAEHMPDAHVVGDFSPTPTPAICISNVPPQATPLSLHSLFGTFGVIETARVVASRRCAYVVFASTIQAIEAQATANGAELFIDNGPNSVAFTHVVSAPPAQGDASGYNVPSVPMQMQPVPVPGGNGGGVASGAGAGIPKVAPIARQLSPESRHQQQLAQAAVPLPATSSPAPVSVAYILQTLNADRTEINEGIEHLRRAASLTFDEPIAPLAELLTSDEGAAERVYNAAVLRDLRRRLETMLAKEVEEVALDMQRELPSLASDYIGNTTVQVVFTRSNQDIRDMMLRRLKDVFAATGTHKNGTWAVQKMIDLAQGPRHYAIIEHAIRPHLVALLLDQFGNYVVQGCLKFGAPYSDFVYSGIASSLAKVAPNRFGARAVRAVLESEHTTVANQRIVATAIVQQIASLATNPNGCLLVSWLLDSFERLDSDMHLRTHSLVAAQLIPQHLVSMCTSKLGSGIVLKLAGSMSNSSQRVFDALLEPLTDRLPMMLVEVLEDPSGQGATCVYRLMTTVFPVQSLERQVTVNKVRMCLLRPGAHIPNHKRLLEEVGLSMLHREPAASPGSDSADRNGHGSQNSHANSHTNSHTSSHAGAHASAHGAHPSHSAHGPSHAQSHGSHGSHHGPHSNNAAHGNRSGSHSSNSSSPGIQPHKTNEELPVIRADKSNTNLVESVSHFGISPNKA